MVSHLRDISDAIIKTQKSSPLENIVDFLEAWLGPDEGFTRIISKKQIKKGNITTLNYHCLDPGIYTEEIFDRAKVSILMSGTLTPMAMHRDLLRIKNAREIELENPFPKENRLNIIIPKTTSQKDKRTPEMYQSIASICASLVKVIPGNSMAFFPSYSFLEQLYPYMKKETNKKIFREERGLSPEEKTSLLNEFKQYKDKGSVLLAVASGSFGEGIDLPGDLLNGAIEVGIPLPTHNLLLQETIKYYDKRFGKGKEYAMRGPAIVRVMQNTGRPIRSPLDKAVAIFLDVRYQYDSYFDLFPKEIRDHRRKVFSYNDDYPPRIKAFFQNR